ncbi:hypothetical protein ANN_05041 [Periplaneta americana]|uniref:Uncharacterized protein n=1 Tax=Periplaneta americana TaxID=6978 RepID=A0ABQ8TBR8_PERAM|nr:hypothetical protein ANN_05041 [Periplaneta americana]
MMRIRYNLEQRRATGVDQSAESLACRSKVGAGMGSIPAWADYLAGFFLRFSPTKKNRNIKSRRLRWAWHVARMSESRNAFRVLVGMPEGKRHLERPRCRWEENIKMDLREVGYGRDWINLAQDKDRWRAYVSAVMNLRVP